MSEENNITQCESILVVEDDQGIRDVLRFSLESEGYKVFTAENGKVALDVLSQISKPCLVLLDLMMPIMNGWDFVDALDKDVTLAAIPVVIVSAFSEQTRIIKSQGFVKKPVDLDTLFQVVKEWCPAKNGINTAAGKTEDV